MRILRILMDTATDTATATGIVMAVMGTGVEVGIIRGGVITAIVKTTAAPLNRQTKPERKFRLLSCVARYKTSIRR
jgi:hypothetical protein